MIAISREPIEFGDSQEQCCLCDAPTPYWSVEKDVPVCDACAQERDESSVPSKEIWMKGI